MMRVLTTKTSEMKPNLSACEWRPRPMGKTAVAARREQAVRTKGKVCESGGMERRRMRRNRRRDWEGEDRKVRERRRRLKAKVEGEEMEWKRERA